MMILKKWRDELVTDLWNYYENSKQFIKEIIDVELPFLILILI